MEFFYTKREITLNNKTLNALDRFTLDFCRELTKANIRYVIISGYPAILFGRSRSSEDIDLFIEPLTQERFAELWTTLTAKFVCLNTDDPEQAYNEYFNNETGLRFSRKNEYIPNMEVKKPVGELEAYNLKERIKVRINDQEELYIGPLELQIAFKLYLGSDKDIEDAKHLFLIFKEHLNKETLHGFITDLQQEKKAEEYLQ